MKFPSLMEGCNHNVLHQLVTEWFVCYEKMISSSEYPENDCYEKEAKLNIKNQEGKEQAKIIELGPDEDISSYPSSYSKHASRERTSSKDSKDKKRPPRRAWKTGGLSSLVIFQENL